MGLTDSPPRGCPPLPPGAKYDPARADRVVRFFTDVLVHPSGVFSGQPLKPADWQEFELLRPMYGYVKWSEQFGEWVPQYSKVWLELPRGAAKTTTMSGLSLFELVAAEDNMPRVYSAAKDRDQAGLVFDSAAVLVEAQPVLSNELKVTRHKKEIEYPGNSGLYKVLASDATGNLGLNPTCTMFDEIVSQPNRDLYDALTTGEGKRKWSRMVMATTAGSNPASFARLEHDVSVQVRDNPALEPSRLVIIYGLKEGDDWESEEVWRKRNPGINAGYVSIDKYREQYKEALLDPTKALAFKTFRLNDWTSQTAEYIPIEQWNDCKSEIDVAKLEGKPCWGGLDLAATSDLTSLCWLFEDPENPGGVMLLWRNWCAGAAYGGLIDATAGLFRTWVDLDWCTVSNRNVIDYDQVHDALEIDCRRFDVQEIGFDQWNIGQTRAKLEAWGIEHKALSQGGPLSGASAELVRLTTARLLRHTGDPVAAWGVACASAAYDVNQRLRVSRPAWAERTRRIDPVMAAIMAVDRWRAALEERAVPRVRPQIIEF